MSQNKPNYQQLKSKLPRCWIEARSPCDWRLGRWLVTMPTAVVSWLALCHTKLLRDRQTPLNLVNIITSDQAMSRVITKRPTWRNALLRHVVVAHWMLLSINFIRLRQILNVLAVEVKAGSTGVTCITGVWQQVIITGWSNCETRNNRFFLCRYTHMHSHKL